jgi:hypothetical protein
MIWGAVAAAVVVAAAITAALLYLPHSSTPSAEAAATTSATGETTAAASSTAAASTAAASTAAAATTTSNVPAGSTAAGGSSSSPAHPAVSVPGLPTHVGWTQDEGEDMPLWSAPASDGGAPITEYRVTLLDLMLNSTRTETWLPQDIGVRHWGCLSNGFPIDQDHYYTFDVAAVNAAGVGPTVTSPQIIGQRC